MNKKGQALVEFLLVLPILIFILLLVVDFGRLMVMRNHLESVLISVDKNTLQSAFNMKVDEYFKNRWFRIWNYNWKKR